jgi:S1-C subfamily serine protease
MTQHRIPLFVAALILLTCLPGLTQTSSEKSTADLVDLVRPAVVQIIIRVTDMPTPDISFLPQGARDCFQQNNSLCVDGTGFFVNANGDVVTASHVANEIQQMAQMLDAHGLHSKVFIGVNLPNVETKGMTFSSGTTLFEATLSFVDLEHDIAAYHSTVNPFTNMPRTFGGPGAAGLPQAKATFLSLAVARPRDAEDIFACGFPFGIPGLVTTSGTIASAWKTQTLPTSTRGIPSEVYWADLRVNPGNSGGPVFRIHDQAVLGIAIGTLNGSIGVVVPSKFISEFLKTHDIQWTSADKS